MTATISNVSAVVEISSFHNLLREVLFAYPVDQTRDRAAVDHKAYNQIVKLLVFVLGWQACRQEIVNSATSNGQS